MELEIFEKLVMHNDRKAIDFLKSDEFDPTELDSFGEPAITSLIYLYGAKETKEEVKALIFEMLNIWFDKYSTNLSALNALDLNFDTPIHIAAEIPALNEFTKKLVTCFWVNLNIVNDFGCSPFGTALKNGNIEIADLIAEQRGFLIRPYEEARIKSVYRLNDYEMKYPDVKIERNTHKVTIENVQSKTERKRIRVKTK